MSRSVDRFTHNLFVVWARLQRWLKRRPTRVDQGWRMIRRLFRMSIRTLRPIAPGTDYGQRPDPTI